MPAHLNAHDFEILRRLGARKAAIAQEPANRERRHAWYAHDSGAGDARPMILAEVCGVMGEVFPDNWLECSDPWARGVEQGLRLEIWQYEVLQDDHVVEPYITTNWQMTVSDYGVAAKMHRPVTDGTLGARNWDPGLEDLDRDFHKLHPRTYSVNREATLATKARLEAIFGGVLEVHLRGSFWWTLGLTWTAIELIGLENLMLVMYDNPEGLHRLMSFLRDDALAYALWLEREGLLTLNNRNDYIGSGSMGYTRYLPQEGHRIGAPARLKDLWVLLESQETVGVGPAQFAEFIYPYQRDIAAHFGKVYYGCCEPVHTRWQVLKDLPHLARVSVSPWCDQALMAQACGKQVVFSRKPNPTQISTEVYDEAAVRRDLRETFAATRGVCRTELAMKDVHTLNRHPARLTRWVQLAREEAAFG